MSTDAHGQHIFLDYNGFFPKDHQDGNWVLRLLQQVVSRSSAKEVHSHVEVFDGMMIIQNKLSNPSHEIVQEDIVLLNSLVSRFERGDI